MMASITQLAIKGGAPVRETWLPYNRQTIDKEDKEAVSKALDSDFITRGPRVKAFEDQVAELVEMPYAVAVNSGTAALHAACFVAGVSAGDEVVVPPLTFAASANAVLYCGGKVRFQDVRQDTLNLNEDHVNAEGAKVVMAVDFAGNPVDYRILQKRFPDTLLIADAAHSLGASLDAKPVGSLADFSTLSFHPVKSMTTTEGGIVVCRDKAHFEALQIFRNHGIEKSPIPGKDQQKVLGFNYHFTDLQAALGLSQLKRMPAFMRRRAEIAAFYSETLSGFDFLKLPQITRGAKSAWHLYPMRLKLDQLRVSRDEFIQALHAENIGSVVHYPLVYKHPYYQEQGYADVHCPVAEQVFEEEISLPIFPRMTDQDAQDVIKALEKLGQAFKL